jgi:ParB family transcriptional regulator, chromosome partitioning protein
MPLGRGLASLIPMKDSKLSVSKKEGFDLALNNKQSVFYVEIEKIKPNPYQPRREFSEGALQELANSLKEYGVIQPLVVSKVENTTDSGINVEYQLIAGERRLRAAELIGLSQVPVFIRKATDEEKLALALIENVQRNDLNPMEKAFAFNELIKKFDLSHKEIAQKISKSREAVSNTLRLLALPVEIQRAVSEGKISEGHARAILSVEGAEKQRALFERIVNMGLTVRQAEEVAKNIKIAKEKNGLLIIDPETKEIESRLQDALGTKVKFHKKGKSGKIIIEFYSAEELDKFLDKVGA